VEYEQKGEQQQPDGTSKQAREAETQTMTQGPEGEATSEETGTYLGPTTSLDITKKDLVLHDHIIPSRAHHECG